MLQQHINNLEKEKEHLVKHLNYQISCEDWVSVAAVATQLSGVEGKIKEFLKLSPLITAMDQDREALRSELERLQRTHSTGPASRPRGVTEPTGGAPSEDPGSPVHHVPCGAV